MEKAGRYKCKQCPKTYDVYASYYGHLTSKHRPHKYICVCTKTYPTFAQFKIHSFDCVSKPPSVVIEKPKEDIIKPVRSSMQSFAAFGPHEIF